MADDPPAPGSQVAPGWSTVVAPVNQPDGVPRPAQPGTGLCLSGGGYRAMLFHLGTLWRLYECGVLARVDRISSVSGGSITAGVLAIAWRRLKFRQGDCGDFIAHVVAPVRRLADRTIDIPAGLGGILLPGTIADRVAATYRKHLFGNATLQDLPDAPRFVINASSVQSAAVWRFSKPYMGDWHVGRVASPKVDLAVAVAASSAFPPFLSPLRLPLDPRSVAIDPTADLQRPPYISVAILTDGGVYDNLGLETVWKRYQTVLVSDGGMAISPEPKPHTDWLLGLKRVSDIIDSQVRALRVRQLIASFAAAQGSPEHRSGTYWSMRANLANYPASTTLDCPPARTMALAATPTRLARLDPTTQERLINWGYAACDAAIRSYVDASLPPPTGFPYDRGV